LRSNARDDPPLGDGWGHMVEEGPYKKHLRGYVAEKDVSTCIAFTALMQKDTRMTTGLRCSGVGGVVCARHELVRPQGVGDLQKGERYSNMDYIVLCAVLGIMAMYLVISYDIACQWRIHFEERMGKMPEELQPDLNQTTVLYGLPVWHAAAHEHSCQVQNSLSYVPGVGRTDGEGIKWTWSDFNPLAWATKEMGAGARHDTIEDKIDHHNFEKNINQVRTTLPRKLILAIEKRDRQVAAFTQVDATLKKDLRKTWQKQVDDWVADHTKPNPYTLADGADGPSEAAIRLTLTWEEAQEAATGGAKLDGSSVTAFLTAGLQLEESQRRIKRAVKGRTLLASDLNERIAEMRLAFFSKLSKFRGPGEDEQALHDSVRVEWSKAKAWKERWEEEVELLREEMKRVLRFLRWRTLWWEERRSSRAENVTPELRAGLNANTARQAWIARELGRKFQWMWAISAATAVRLTIAEEGLLMEGMAALGSAEEGDDAPMMRDANDDGNAAV
ncbi:hypothetical protein B0H16DRAFT_1312626, partial [Mycena metata]